MWPHGASTPRGTDSPVLHPAIRAALSARSRRRIGGSRAEIAAQDRRVCVNSPIAQERPVAPRLLDQCRIAASHENLRLSPGLRQNASERIGDEGVAEELD